MGLFVIPCGLLAVGSFLTKRLSLRRFSFALHLLAIYSVVLVLASTHVKVRYDDRGSDYVSRKPGFSSENKAKDDVGSENKAENQVVSNIVNTVLKQINSKEQLLRGDVIVSYEGDGSLSGGTSNSTGIDGAVHSMEAVSQNGEDLKGVFRIVVDGTTQDVINLKGLPGVKQFRVLLLVKIAIITFQENVTKHQVHETISRMLNASQVLTIVNDCKDQLDNQHSVDIPSGETQWHLGPDSSLNMPKAWELMKQHGGEKILVAVIDTGVDFTHMDLKGSIWTNPNEIENGIDDDNNGCIDDIVGCDFDLSRPNGLGRSGVFISMRDVTDPHGTHVAGIIGATNASGNGARGVADKYVKMMIIRARNLSGKLLAFNYIVAMGVKISCNSWSFKSEQPTINHAIKNAEAKGHLFITSAGNYKQNFDNPTPDVRLSYPQVDLKGQKNYMIVGFTDRLGNKNMLSNYGRTHVHLFAKGTDIYSTFIARSQGAVPYRSESGTSYSCPMVVGVAVLIKYNHPQAKYNEIVDIIMKTVKTSDALKNLAISGGEVDAYAALLEAARLFDGTEATTPLVDISD